VISTKQRIENLLSNIEKEKIDGLLIIKNEILTKENARYVTGFSGSSAYIVVSPKKEFS